MSLACLARSCFLGTVVHRPMRYRLCGSAREYVIVHAWSEQDGLRVVGRHYRPSRRHDRRVSIAVVLLCVSRPLCIVMKQGPTMEPQ